MKLIHLFSGNLTDMETRTVCALARGEMPEGWEKIRTGSEAVVFSNHEYFLKIFPQETLGQKVKTILKTRSLHSTGNSSVVIQKETTMAAFGFLVATVIAHGRVYGRSFLLTRRIPGITLREALLYCKGKSKFALIQKLANEVARLHDKGIYHGDLNANNIIVAKHHRNYSRFYFLDNEKNKFYRKTPARKAERNLSQLNYLILPKVVNKTDRLRFLITYLNKRKISENKKKWWFNILNRFQKRRKRKNGQ